MSDPTAAAPLPPNQTPTPGAIEFVNQGIIRIHFPTPNGTEDLVVRVRRPFLGELKTIRLRLDEIRDDLAILSTEIIAEGAGLAQEATELARQRETDELTPQEHSAALADIRRRDRAAAIRLEDAREEKMLDWWSEIFSMLALDPVPDRMSYPAWILDATLTQTVLTHWRQVPSGPG